MIKKVKKLISAIKRIHTLEKKVILMNNELRMFMPELIPMNIELVNELEKFEKKYGLTESVNYTISKNDLMYRYACYHIGDMQKAYTGYMETGLNPRNIIVKLIDAVYGDLKKPDSILDFASGYGRVTRFLVSTFGADKVWASEVKPKALAFIQEQFNCRTIQSSFVPEEFSTDQHFDVIYVGSLFSHLPEDLFVRWLEVLYNIISDDGILILSTHDISLLGKKDKNAFVFVKDSEDQLFNDVDDHIEDVGNYGATFIGIDKLTQLFAGVGIQSNQYCRFEHVLSNVQDVYVIRKKELKLITNPDLTSYP